MTRFLGLKRVFLGRLPLGRLTLSRLPLGLALVLLAGCRGLDPALSAPLRSPQLSPYAYLPDAARRCEAPYLRYAFRVPESEGIRVWVRVAGEQVATLGLRDAWEPSDASRRPTERDLFARFDRGEDKRLVAAIDVYVSDFGDHRSTLCSRTIFWRI